MSMALAQFCNMLPARLGNVQTGVCGAASNFQPV